MVISLYDLIAGRARDNKMAWVTISDDMGYRATKLFRAYLVGKCRPSSKRAIQFSNMTFRGKNNEGIYQRLTCNLTTMQVEYTAGQDQQTEIERIKTLLLK